jgi:(3R)-3-hydroxyacyl-CoA dehydrogenase / 3a,7a,12a-trihydroxy-5b-cholest-24-enoyl-CoA hydratase / enoyl-CoA hydratase 2
MSQENHNRSLLDAVGHTFEATSFSYAEKDAALFALSIGASSDPLDATDLQYTYELAPSGFHCFPTFAATFPLRTLEQITSVPGQSLNLMEVLHGEHYLELSRPLPPRGMIVNEATISQVYDKGSGALIIVDITSSDESGAHVAFNQASIFVRGRGNFGGERGPSSRENAVPERTADALFSEITNENQALLYRLTSGDHNPLHADSRFAALLGYPRPILHGLCTYGYAARAVLKTYAGNDAHLFKSIRARFSSHVFPGETIETEMWQESAVSIRFRSRVVERDDVVLTNGVVILQGA